MERERFKSLCNVMTLGRLGHLRRCDPGMRYDEQKVELVVKSSIG